MKKFKSFFAFLLSLIICFSVFPSTVFAKTYNSTKATVAVWYSGSSMGFQSSGEKQIPFTFTYAVPQKYVYEIDVVSDDKYAIASGDAFTFTFKNSSSSTRYQRFGSVRIYLIDSANYDTYYLYVSNNGVVADLGSSFATDVTYNFSSSNTFTVSGTMKHDNPSPYFIKFELLDPVVSSSYSDADFQFTVYSISCETTDAQEGFFNKVGNFFTDLFNRLTSWFNDLFQWLKDIRDGNISFADSVKSAFTTITDNIKNFFSELGKKLTDGFSNLTSSISTFFTNLGNNLKEWFNNVGQWFTDIGDRIGNFFTNLWNNISDRISSITTAVSDWWQSVVDFFHSLFVPEDGYFDSYKQNWEQWAREHFALFFDVEDIFEMLFGVFEGDQLEKGLTIPEVKLPFFNNPVIIPQTTFYFSQIINQHTAIKRIYDMFQIGFSVIVYGLLLVYLQRTFSKILTDDEGAL